MSPFLKQPHPDDEYLTEKEYNENGRPMWDPVEGGPKYTERAKKARMAKYERLFKVYAPSELISEEMLPSLENPQPPILYYGWSYSEQWLFEYAKAHKLVHYFTPEYYKATQRAMIEYGKLTDDCEEMQNQESRDFLLGFLDILVRQDLEERCGVNLEMCIPFCDQTKYCGVYALYTNYNAEKRYAEIENVVDIDEVCAEMDEAMNECGNEAKLMWWFDVDNPISLLDTPV